MTRNRATWILGALLLSGCGGGGGGGGGDENWYYHFRCNGDAACLSTNFAGAPEGTSNQGPGQGGESGCNSLMTFGSINWNIPPAEQWCDHSSTIPPPVAPTVDLTVAPPTIQQGASATLTWTSTNATSCTASNAWSGAKALNGNQNVTPAGGSYTYTLTCTGPGGSASDSATLTVNAPSVSISVAPTPIIDGQSATLTWSSSNTSACTASGAWTGSTALSGSTPVSPSVGSFTYTLSCTGAGGAIVSDSTTLTVSPTGALQSPPTVTISVDPASVASGAPTTLTWSTTRATACTASGSWSGDKPLSGNEAVLGPSPGSYEFALTCTGSGGSASGVATLTVPSGGTLICSPPSVAISASPSPIVEGQTSTVTWSAAKDPFCSSPQFSCVASGAWNPDPVAASGSFMVAPSAGSFTYTLTCAGRNATNSQSATLVVTASGSPPAPVVTLDVSPAAINLGESSTLSWSTSGVRNCTASGAWSGAVGLSGSVAVSPVAAGSYDYVLTCQGSNASAADTATLSVEAAAGTTATARFDHPYRLVVDSTDNVFVADTSNSTIRKITPANVVTTVAGLAGITGSADGTGATARFNLPFGIAIDGSDTLYVADSFNHTIRTVTPAAAVTTLAGLAGMTGSADSPNPRFSLPMGVAVDGSGNVYVADHDAHIIRMVTPAGVVSTIAGTAGVPGSTDATGAAASFSGPQDVAVDAAGNIYVADTDNHTIRKIVCSPACAVTTLAGLAGAQGNANNTGSLARFDAPKGVATDSASNVYVADSNSSTIRKVTPAGVVTTFAGISGSPGFANGAAASAQFRAATGVATDGADNVYVADTFNCMIRKITQAGTVSTVAGAAQVCASNN